MENYDNLIFILNGPSASGKSTILDELLKDSSLGLDKLITTTTRKSRSGETDGINYYFMETSEFLKRLEETENGSSDDPIVEYTEYPKGSGIYYGNRDSEIKRVCENGSDVIAVLDINGVEKFKNFYGYERVVSIFVYRDLGSIKIALEERKISSDELSRRMEYAKEELKNIAKADYVIYNLEDKDALIQSAKEIIDKVRKARKK